jgi:dephospho-CoA kinase
MARRILAAQLPIAEKIKRGDWVVWNNGPAGVLRNQARRFLQSLELETNSG